MNIKVKSVMIALAVTCTVGLAACSGGDGSMKGAVEICDPLSAESIIRSYKADPKRDSWTPERKEYVSGDVSGSASDLEFLSGCSVDAKFVPGNPLAGMVSYGPAVQIYVLAEGSSAKDAVLGLRESHQTFQNSGQNIPAPQYYVRSDNPRIIAVNMNVTGLVQGEKAETQQHQVDEALTSHGWVTLGSAW